MSRWKRYAKDTHYHHYKSTYACGVPYKNPTRDDDGYVTNYHGHSHRVVTCLACLKFLKEKRLTEIQEIERAMSRRSQATPNQSVEHSGIV